MKEQVPPQALYFYKTDKDGYILNELNIKNVKKNWIPVIEYIKKLLIQNCRDNLISIFLSGKAVNDKIKITEDLGVIIILKQKQDLSFLKDFQLQFLEKKFPFIKHISYVTMIISSFENNNFQKFYIKYECLFLYGQNIAKDLPAFKADSSINFYSGKLLKYMPKWLALLNENELDSESVKRISSYIMEILLFTGFELCIEKEKKYTSDYYTCYKTFSKYYRELEPHMKKVIQYINKPTDDTKEVLLLLKKLGTWLMLRIQVNNIEKELNNKKI